MSIILNPAPGQSESRSVLTPGPYHLPSKFLTPIVNEDAIIDLVGRELKKLNLDFADFRLGVDARRDIDVQDTSIRRIQENESQGIGIRILYDGCWAHIATDNLTEAGLQSAVAQCYKMAKTVASLTPDDMKLKSQQWAAEQAHIDQFHTYVEQCAFQIPAEKIARYLLEATEIGLSCQNISRAVGNIEFQGYRRNYVNTDGARILTTHALSDGYCRFYATVGKQTEYRTIKLGTKAGGAEHLVRFNFASQAKDACLEAMSKCTAKKPDSGRYNLILDPQNLALTMHESVGHPTELDRVLGYEFGFAGGSFARIQDLGKLQYGSSLVNFTADNTLQYGAASIGYDDEGVACQRFPVIEQGVLVGFGTNRETAHLIGQKRANGTCRSQYWKDSPIVRIPNLYLEPGKQPLKLDELIADTKQGILMLGWDSFSIDQMRYNFQFGADMCYRIENGQLTEPLRDVIYQAVSTEFWNSCDAICDESEWKMAGFLNCGKGQPNQSARMMHGASPSRFHNISVGY